MKDAIKLLPYFTIVSILIVIGISHMISRIRRARYERLFKRYPQLGMMNPYRGYGYPSGLRSIGTAFVVFVTILLFMLFGYVRLNYRSWVSPQYLSMPLDTTQVIEKELNNPNPQLPDTDHDEPDANQSQHLDTSRWESDDGSAPDLTGLLQANELTGAGQLPGGQAIQIASFGNWENAFDNFSKEIDNHWPRYQVILGMESIAETLMYKILLGSFKNAEEAEAELRIIQQQYPKAYLKDLAEIEIDSYTEQ